MSDASPPNRIAQACAIPYRRHGDEWSLCLITSLKKKNWIFPKGIIDPGETLEETALKEAFEEAGVRGRIVGEPVGVYSDAKWGAILDVTVVLMEVDHAADDWPEAAARHRRWAPPAEAEQLVARPELRQILAAAIPRLKP